VGPKNWTKFRTFRPPVKNRGGLVEMSIRIIRATPVYFLPGGSRRSHVGRLTKKLKKCGKYDVLPLIAAGSGCPKTFDVLNRSTPARQQHL